MAHHAPTEQFVRHLTEYQSRLYAYILALLGDPNVVNDVLQDTNVTIWRKADEFIEGSNFGAWASRVAYYEVLAYRKRRGKDRHVFDDALLEKMAAEVARNTESMDAELATLHRCIEKLPQRDKELVRRRYAPGGSVKRLAELRGKSAGAISQTLYRIRHELANCVEQALKSEDVKSETGPVHRNGPTNLRSVPDALHKRGQSAFLPEDGP